MHKTWLVVANAHQCRIFQYQKAINQLTLLNKFQHEESKLKRNALVADGSGSYRSSSAVNAAYSEIADPKYVEKQNFAREIVGELEQGRVASDFNDLFIVAPPQFHGLINKNCNKNLSRMVVKDVQKDYCACDKNKLLDFICQCRSEINSLE